MRIYYDDPSVRYIRIDREALTIFLREQSVSEQKMKQLVIRIRPRIPRSYVSEACQAETTLGVSRLNSVVICTWQHPKDANKLNNTLLHELYHFMTKGTYGPDNYAIEYAKRPSEIAARAFAKQHEERIFLMLDLPPVQPQLMPAKMEQPVATAEPLPGAIPTAISLPSPTLRHSAVVGAALTIVGLGVLLLKPVLSRLSIVRLSHEEKGA